MYKFLKYFLLLIIGITLVIFLINKKNVIDFANHTVSQEYKSFLIYKEFDSNSLNTITLKNNDIYFNGTIVSHIENINLSIGLDGVILNLSSINNIFKDALPKIFKGIKNLYISSFVVNNKITINFDNKFNCSYNFLDNHVECDKHNKIITELLKGIQ
jgi:hypothetical protein